MTRTGTGDICSVTRVGHMVDGCAELSHNEPIAVPILSLYSHFISQGSAASSRPQSLSLVLNHGLVLGFDDDALAVFEADVIAIHEPSAQNELTADGGNREERNGSEAGDLQRAKIDGRL